MNHKMKTTTSPLTNSVSQPTPIQILKPASNLNPKLISGPIRPPNPLLRFSPTAWAKLLFLRDLGDTEVGGFGVTATDDLLLIEDIKLVRQTCTAVTVEFDDNSVADFFDHEVDSGLKPQQFARIWVHSHPGNCPQPSIVDENTFNRVFGRTDWALMFILARGGRSYARLRFNIGPGGEMPIPVSVDFSRPFAGSNHDTWREEYLANVSQEECFFLDERQTHPPENWDKNMFAPSAADEDWLDEWPDLFDELPNSQELSHEYHA
jgi:proteasome lid subunit RPN8/RPN11